MALRPKGLLLIEIITLVPSEEVDRIGCLNMIWVATGVKRCTVFIVLYI